MTLSRCVAACLLIAVASPTLARAQRPQPRSGFWLGIGTGVGSFGCSECDGRLSGGTADISLGGTLSPHVLLGGGITLWAKSANGVTLSSLTLVATIRYYPVVTSGFQLIGGLGLGETSIDQSYLTVSSSGTAASLGAGYDVRIARNVSLTPFLQAHVIALDGGTTDFGQFGVRLTLH
jgi:hypothetical protein